MCLFIYNFPLLNIWKLSLKKAGSQPLHILKGKTEYIHVTHFINDTGVNDTHFILRHNENVQYITRRLFYAHGFGSNSVKGWCWICSIIKNHQTFCVNEQSASITADTERLKNNDVLTELNSLPGICRDCCLFCRAEINSPTSSPSVISPWYTCAQTDEFWIFFSATTTPFLPTIHRVTDVHGALTCL